MDKYVIMIVAILILNIDVMHNILGDENWLTSGLTSTKTPRRPCLLPMTPLGVPGAGDPGLRGSLNGNPWGWYSCLGVPSKWSPRGWCSPSQGLLPGESLKLTGRGLVLHRADYRTNPHFWLYISAKSSSNI